MFCAGVSSVPGCVLTFDEFTVQLFSSVILAVASDLWCFLA